MIPASVVNCWHAVWKFLKKLDFSVDCTIPRRRPLQFFDLELLPASHMRQLHLAVDIFGRVAERNAHERCRRFETARLDLSPAEALQHVEDRTEDLAQTRPEYGNSTNAVCFVGRRSRVRGLYLDRRSFLMSYEQVRIQNSP